MFINPLNLRLFTDQVKKTELHQVDLPEDFRMNGRLQDEDDDQQRKKHKPTDREQSHLENLPTVGAERGDKVTNTSDKNKLQPELPTKPSLGSFRAPVLVLLSYPSILALKQIVELIFSEIYNLEIKRRKQENQIVTLEFFVSCTI